MIVISTYTVLKAHKIFYSANIIGKHQNTKLSDRRKNLEQPSDYGA